MIRTDIQQHRLAAPPHLQLCSRTLCKRSLPPSLTTRALLRAQRSCRRSSDRHHSFTSSFIHSACQRPALRHRGGGGALTALRGVSQILEGSHGSLCALNVLFSFCDVQVLGGRLLGSFCCWLNENTESLMGLPRRPLEGPQKPWDNGFRQNKHTPAMHLQQLLCLAPLRNQRSNKNPSPKEETSL